ncbi:acyl-CoA synthetase, partial [Plasmodium gaboni]
IISIDKCLFFKSLKDDNMLERIGVNEKNYLHKLTDDNINNDILVDYVKEKMMEVYKETNLNRYNIINNIYLTSKTWDTNNYLTPTLKVKRFSVFKDYAFFIDEVKNIYKNKLKGTVVVDSKNNGEKEKKDSKRFEDMSHSNEKQKNLGKNEKDVENKKVKLGTTHGTGEQEMNK